MPRYLVTGAAGFVGSHLVDRLRSDGHDVIGLDRRPGADVQGDLLTMDLAPLLHGAAYVIHLAGQPGVRESWDRFADYSRGNIETTQRLLEALREQSIRKFVLASTSSVYGAAPMPAREDGPVLPVSPYGATKLAAESLCDLYGRTAAIPWITLRFFTVYGPRQREDMAFARWFRAALADRPIPVFGDGQQTRDFTYVADAVEAICRAAKAPAQGMALNVGGGSQASVRQALGLIEQVTGRRLRLEYHPPAKGDMRETRADTQRLAETLGFVPATPLIAGLEHQYRWVTGGAANP